MILKYFGIIALLFIAHSFATKSITISNLGENYAPGDLIWEDHFDTLDPTKWDFEANMNGGGDGAITPHPNEEFQVYDRDENQTYVEDGVLYIHPMLTIDKPGYDEDRLFNGYHYVECCTSPPRAENCDRQAIYPRILQPAFSGRIRTLGRFSFRYGKVEIRAKVPAGDWMFPAMWLLPEDEVYGGWPSSGEIDIMESRGNRKLFRPGTGINIGTEQISSTLNYGPKFPYNGWENARNSTNTPPDQGFDRDFHLYQMEWTNTSLIFLMDGVQYLNVTPPEGVFYELGRFDPSETENIWANGTNPRMAPFDEKFHFILNVAVGGIYFEDYGEGPVDPPPPWGTEYDRKFLEWWEARNDWIDSWKGPEAALRVDYIKVWAV